MLRLGVLDQSPVGPDGSAAAALKRTLELARLADRLGYSRFWVSEHHNARSLAGVSPEVLISAVGAHTARIRIGSGGVLLPHYSPYKVAENFRVLEGLYPGRIDLGIGRAPGGLQLVSRALRGGAPLSGDERLPELLKELAAYLEIGSSFDSDAPFRELEATPRIETAPDIWLLGSSGYSAALAAQLGAGFSFAHFINGQGGQEAVRSYRQQYRPGPLGSRPQVSVCVYVLCADTDEQAEWEAMAMDLRLLANGKGEFHRLYPTPGEAAAYPYTARDRAAIAKNRKRMIVGGPDRVRRELESFAAGYGTDEIIVTCGMSDFRLRLRCYEWLAALFDSRRGGIFR